MGKIRRGIKTARDKLARSVSGLSRAERRVKHHKQREHYWAAKRDAAPKNDATRATFERKRKHAHDLKRKWQKRQTKAAAKHAYLETVLDRRLAKKKKWLETHKPPPGPTSGVAQFDGHEVAAWIVHDILEPARAKGYWHGSVISGYRDPAYSESLCLHMCGAPSCPGLCAGRSSNHSGSVKPAGAVDLTDPGGTVAYARSVGIEWHGAGEVLPSDTPHCSTTGN